jgi:hypothetical protein
MSCSQILQIIFYYCLLDEILIIEWLHLMPAEIMNALPVAHIVQVVDPWGMIPTSMHWSLQYIPTLTSTKRRWVIVWIFSEYAIHISDINTIYIWPSSLMLRHYSMTLISPFVLHHGYTFFAWHIACRCLRFFVWGAILFCFVIFWTALISYFPMNFLTWSVVLRFSWKPLNACHVSATGTRPVWRWRTCK